MTFTLSVFSSILILFFVIVFQYNSYLRTQGDRKDLGEVFPVKPYDELSIESEDNAVGVMINLSKVARNEIFSEIVDNINVYLKNNGGIAEYAILKDITDRHCDALKEQIESTTPVPIYIGLCGTLVGIVFGVTILAFGGSLDAILNTSSSNGAEGIQALLQGVAVAMLSTLSGVFLTIRGSSTYKSAAKENEKRKNAFLSWMQVELLPQMDNSMIATLDILKRNLNQFNKTFSENSANLRKVFAGISDNYKGQAEVSREVQKVLQSVRSLQINDMATANIRVLKELQLCTDKINLLQEFLNQTDKYLTSIESLNNNLSDQYERTKLIENMGQFFMSEVQQIEQRKSAIKQAVAEVDFSLSDAFDNIKEHTRGQYQQLKDAASTEHLYFLTAIEEQQKVLSEKLEETSGLMEELHNLVDVKESMVSLLQASKEQGILLADVKTIMKDVATTNNSHNDMMGKLIDSVDNMAVSVEPMMPTKITLKAPLWVKIVGCFTCLVIVGTCAFFIIKQFI